jgi:hypothetical protein
VRNDDWLLWDLRRGDGGAEITRAHGESSAGKKQP